MTKPTLLYLLHSGNLYGTERMALYTVEALRDAFDPVLYAPPGPLHAEAARRGLDCHEFHGARHLAGLLWPRLKAASRLAVFATGVSHSLIVTALNLLSRRPTVHLHLVHGGTDERLSYGRKRRLNRLPVTFVAVSAFVRERLQAHGVRAGQIRVIENCLPAAQIVAAPRRAAFTADGVQRLVIVSRIDPIKRIGLLLDALDAAPDLADLPIDILGTGWELDTLRARAAERHPNVQFLGFQPDVAERLAQADMLLHLCPEEPFGLAILEAMAAGVPVLVPDRGGAGSLVTPGVDGLHFHADDVADLRRALRELRTLPAARLNALRTAADAALRGRFSEQTCMNAYRALLQPLLEQ